MNGSSVRFATISAAAAAIAVAALGLSPAAAAGGGARPHSAAAAPAAPKAFGAHLTTHSQPANVGHGVACAKKSQSCTRVMSEAYHRSDPDTEQRAPRDGTIGHVKIVALGPGAFRLQIVKAKLGSDKAKVLRNSPLIHYKGQNPTGEDNGPPYTVESFAVKLKVDKGDFLAIKAKRATFFYCSGSSGVIEFQPALKPGAKYRTGAAGDCLMLLEAVYKK
jgi:hypothetical protein